MDEIKLWVLVGALAIMSSILGFIMKVVTNQVIRRLDDVVKELRQLTNVTTQQQGQINNLMEGNNTVQHRLNDHAKRIRHLEIINSNELMKDKTNITE